MKSSKSRLRKLARLSAADFLLLLRVAGLLALVSMALRLVPFRIVRRHVSGDTRHSVRAACPVERLVWAVEVAGRSVGTACLGRALGLQWLLSRRGVATELWLGVQPVANDRGPDLRAHAWVTLDGRTILGAPADRTFTPLYSFATGVPSSPRGRGR